MIDVLMVTQNDWANTGYRFSKCLEFLGLRVLYLKGVPHHLRYPQQGTIDRTLTAPALARHPVYINVPSYKALMEGSHVVHFIASTFVNTGADLTQKNVVVQHGGSTYRIDPLSCNKIFNPVADQTIVQCPDLLGLGAENEHLIYYPVDTELLAPSFKPAEREKIKIGHFPSTPTTKGTDVILEVIGRLLADPELKDHFEYVGATNIWGESHRVPWEANLQRMKECDLLIETQKPFLELGPTGPKPYGEWGNTAIEAASLGKVVVTNSLTSDLYAREYGDCALNISNSPEELETILRRLIMLPHAAFVEEQKKTRDWVVKSHSMKATAIRLWEKVYSNFFPEKWTEEAPNMNNLVTPQSDWIELGFKNQQLAEIVIKK